MPRSDGSDVRKELKVLKYSYFLTFWGFPALLKQEATILLPLAPHVTEQPYIHYLWAAGEGRIQDMKHTHTPWPVTQQKLLLLFEGVEKKWWCFVWVACIATWESGKCLLCTLFSNLALDFRISSMHKNA